MEKSIGVKFADKANGNFAMPRTTHRIVLGDARAIPEVATDSVHLVVTSPPYWMLKEYKANPSQLGAIEDYERFLEELDRVWRECYRVLCPGGRLCIVVGDVCLSRSKHGRHRVIPLHSDIQVRCRRIGFDNLAPSLLEKFAITYSIRYNISLCLEKSRFLFFRFQLPGFEAN